MQTLVPFLPIFPSAEVPPTQQVPDWEKDFCASESHIPWERLTDTKKVINFYGEATHWDDSAEEEAFSKAKSRYWAKINGLQCDNPFPDPDEYIDLDDFYAVGDPEIDQDLDHPPTSPVESESDGAPCRLTSNHIFFVNEPIEPSGWGGESDDPAPANYARLLLLLLDGVKSLMIQLQSMLTIFPHLIHLTQPSAGIWLLKFLIQISQLLMSIQGWIDPGTTQGAVLGQGSRRGIGAPLECLVRIKEGTIIPLVLDT